MPVTEPISSSSPKKKKKLPSSSTPEFPTPRAGAEDARRPFDSGYARGEASRANQIQGMQDDLFRRFQK